MIFFNVYIHQQCCACRLSSETCSKGRNAGGVTSQLAPNNNILGRASFLHTVMYGQSQTRLKRLISYSTEAITRKFIKTNSWDINDVQSRHHQVWRFRLSTVLIASGIQFNLDCIKLLVLLTLYLLRTVLGLKTCRSTLIVIRQEREHKETQQTFYYI